MLPTTESKKLTGKNFPLILNKVCESINSQKMNRPTVNNKTQFIIINREICKFYETTHPLLVLGSLSDIGISFSFTGGRSFGFSFLSSPGNCEKLKQCLKNTCIQIFKPDTFCLHFEREAAEANWC